MILRSLTIKNFRSITRAKKLQLAESTVLIGPNNEGKSNVLRALVLATRLLLGRGQKIYTVGRGYSRFRDDSVYNWERDYPISLQEKSPDGKSVFTLEYELSEEEIVDFRKDVKSRLNGTLPIEIEIGQNRAYQITVKKKGPGGSALTKKKEKIAEFVADRIDLEYIPAIRTAASARKIVESMVARELATLERTEDYQKAIEKIAELQAPVLKDLSEGIKKTLIQFLPAVSSVEVVVPTARRYEALRNSDIYIDDGFLTSLQYKGDGVQSLAALALMRHAAIGSSLGKHIVIAIEEPESHLHPAAIHELRSVIEQLSSKHQVVITTHCPLFVSRTRIQDNIIVKDRKAVPARSIEEIRNTLGVRASDNLQHAELVLAVEGEDDRKALTALFSHHSDFLRKALSQNTLAIDTLGGASKLVYKLGLLRDSICNYHCLLDDDEEGRRAFDKARIGRLVTDAEVNFTICSGLDEAELEDLYSTELINQVLEAYNIHNPQCRKNYRKKKWSIRMKEIFRNAGKRWTDNLSINLKMTVAEHVEENPAKALNPQRRVVFDALVTCLEKRLGK